MDVCAKMGIERQPPTRWVGFTKRKRNPSRTGQVRDGFSFCYRGQTTLKHGCHTSIVAYYVQKINNMFAKITSF